MIGNVLGNRYRILREIGAGGMAKVFLAEDVKSNELVALKLLYPQFSEDISFVQRFNREAKLASTLTDPHIVRVIDYGADRDQHYLIMDYVEGQDLNDKLQKEGQFQWEYALEIIDQLATALEHAHSHGVVHRDIKPQNLMLNDSGLLKVLDFGIARMPTLPSLTQSGFIGSPYYASPEQAMGEEVDIRSDVYSSGIVLYELLSGNIPFDAKSPWSIISQHITSEPPPIELDDGEIPERVKILLGRMLAKRPDERFQSPAALRQAIAAVLAGQAIPEVGQDTLTAAADNTSLVESLYDRATTALEAQEWMRAVDLLSQAAKLDPKNPEVAEKLALAEAEARLSSLYRSGKRAMEGGRWEEAINHFNVITELQTDYLDIQQLLDTAHDNLKEENAQQFVATRYQEGMAHFETGRWDSAIEALQDVQHLSPGYEQTETLLDQAQAYRNPTLAQRLSQIVGQGSSNDTWRWGLVAVGILVIAILSFLAFGNNTNASREQLKVLYEEAQTAIAVGEQDEALTKLDQILAEDPDYADVASLRRELVATPTPTPAPTVILVATATPENAPQVEMLAEAEDAITSELWTEAIEKLVALQETNPDFQTAQVAALLCDAYAGRGQNKLSSIEPASNEAEFVQSALADFEDGTALCPRRTDLQEQADRAEAYLTVLEMASDDYEMLIRTLTPIVAAAPAYTGGNAKQMLYEAYVGRAAVRQAPPENIAGALGDYEAALALNVDDPSDAQTRRAELLLSFTQQPPLEPQQAEATTTAVAAEPTLEATSSAEEESTPSPQPASFQLRYPKPALLGPPEDALFAGPFADVVLQWEPVGELAPDEYYDLTIMHLFADEPKYNGSTRTQDTQVRITNDIGVGEAGGDRFYWWVTVRKDGTAPVAGGLDRAMSPRSDAKTFIWSQQ